MPDSRGTEASALWQERASWRLCLGGGTRYRSRRSGTRVPPREAYSWPFTASLLAANEQRIRGIQAFIDAFLVTAEVPRVMTISLSALALCRVAYSPDTHEQRAAGFPPSDAAFGVSPDSMVSVAAVRALVEVVTRAGFPGAELLEAAQLRPEQLAKADARIRRSELYLLCARALELTNDPALGLHWAEKLTESTFIPISQLIAYAPTLRHGFESMAQFVRILSDETDYQVIESEDTVTLRAVPLIGAPLPAQRFLAEMMVAGFFRLLRDFSTSAMPHRVNFAYQAPSYHAEYTRVFERTVMFGQPFTGIVFDRALLDLPAPHKDRDLHEAFRAVAQRRLLETTQRTTFTERVREHLVRKGGPHRTDMEEAARAVGLSVRSLRRRLSGEGSSYQEVANEALTIVAKHMLMSTQFSIQETGYAMGFADARSFHRAFRRWTGITPGAYRRAQREGPTEE